MYEFESQFYKKHKKRHSPLKKKYKDLQKKHLERSFLDVYQNQKATSQNNFPSKSYLAKISKLIEISSFKKFIKIIKS